jgi:hypothetical protein
MSKQPPHQFAADGQQRIRATDDYLQQVREIHTRIRIQYRDALAHASFWRRWRLKWKIQREIRQACAEVVG